MILTKEQGQRVIEELTAAQEDGWKSLVIDELEDCHENPFPKMDEFQSLHEAKPKLAKRIMLEELFELIEAETNREILYEAADAVFTIYGYLCSKGLNGSFLSVLNAVCDKNLAKFFSTQEEARAVFGDDVEIQQFGSKWAAVKNGKIQKWA